MPIVKTKKGAQYRPVPRNGWTVARRKLFLDTLAATCNVLHSATVAGMTDSGARQLKKRDGEFARLWAEALEEGRERLVEKVFANSLAQGSTGDNPEGERAVPSTGPFDARLAMEALKRHGTTDPSHRRAKAGTRPTQTEVDIALMERLDALARRLAKS